MSKTRDDVKGQLTTIFREVFDDDEIELYDEMTAKDIEEWDSVEHISLVLSVEKEFDVQLSAAQVGQLKNVGEMIDTLLVKTNK